MSNISTPLIKLLSWLSVVRIHNLVILIIAQLVTALFLADHTKSSVLSILLDINIWVIILSCSCIVASGYIINDYFDRERDVINKPIKTQLDSIHSQNSKFITCFILNIIGLCSASYISFRAAIFFGVYLMAIGIYSFYLKKILFVNTIMISCLNVIPLFAITLYYKNFDTIVFGYALFLFFIILIKQMLKDLESIDGDFTNQYHTIPVVYGEKMAKIVLRIYLILTLGIILGILLYFDIGLMSYYLYFCILILSSVLLLLTKTNHKKHYLILYNVFQLLIGIGIFNFMLSNFINL